MEYRITLRYFILAIIISITVANSIIIFSDSHNKRSSTLVILNTTAAIASGFGIIAICRHGLQGLHGKSYLFLTIGLIFWFAGYVFLALHLFTVLRLIRTKINLMTIVVASVTTVLFISYNVFNIISSSAQSHLV